MKKLILTLSIFVLSALPVLADTYGITIPIIWVGK